MLLGWPQGHRPKAKPPADSRAVWEIASAIEDGAGCDPPHDEARRAHPPADRLPHQARRPDLRALLGLGHGADRSRDDRAALLVRASWPSAWPTFLRCRGRWPQPPADLSIRGRKLQLERSERTIDRYIARARKLMLEQGRTDRQEVFAESMARKQRLYTRAIMANQLKTALAVQDSIDRMCGNYRDIGSDMSAVDQWLAALKVESLEQVQASAARRLQGCVQDKTSEHRSGCDVGGRPKPRQALAARSQLLQEPRQPCREGDTEMRHNQLGRQQKLGDAQGGAADETRIVGRGLYSFSRAAEISASPPRASDSGPSAGARLRSPSPLDRWYVSTFPRWTASASSRSLI